MRSHLRSPDEMNWSITTWAPLAKSPNCASQMVRVFGSASEKPYSKPSTASSDSAEFDALEVRLARADVVQRRVVLFGGLIDDVAVALHEGAAHAVLAGQPHRIALVEQAAEGQVLGRWPSRCPRRPRWPRGGVSITRRTVLCTSSRSGRAVSFRPMSRSFCSGTAVSPRRSSPSAVAMCAHLPSSQSALSA